MDYSILAAEIALPQYATMPDAEIAAALSSASIRVRQHVPIGILRDTALRIGVYNSIVAAQRNPDLPTEIWSICEIVKNLPALGVESVNMDEPASQQMFGALLQAQIINAQQAAAIDALATAATISRAEQIGLGAVVTVEDIERARIVPQLDALRVRLSIGYNAAVEELDWAQTVPEWAELIAVIEAA
jgi:hypothetical protein